MVLQIEFGCVRFMNDKDGMTQDALDDPLVRKARECAWTCFHGLTRTVATGRGLVRKPFFAHPEEVALLLAEANATPTVIAAGLLHDVLQERSDWSLLRLEKEFGSQVAKLVFWVEEEHKHLPWTLRTNLYYAKLQDAPVTALSIVCATRLSNIRSINRGPLEEMLSFGFDRCGWAPMSGTLEEKLLYYQRLSLLFRGNVPQGLYQSFLRNLAFLEKLRAEAYVITKSSVAVDAPQNGTAQPRAPRFGGMKAV